MGIRLVIAAVLVILVLALAAITVVREMKSRQSRWDCGPFYRFQLLGILQYDPARNECKTISLKTMPDEYGNFDPTSWRELCSLVRPDQSLVAVYSRFGAIKIYTWRDPLAEITPMP